MFRLFSLSKFMVHGLITVFKVHRSKTKKPNIQRFPCIVADLTVNLFLLIHRSGTSEMESGRGGYSTKFYAARLP